ncbi:MAG: hypothetical protein R2860_02220 [Desulfobacterales bacterium]
MKSSTMPIYARRQFHARNRKIRCKEGLEGVYDIDPRSWTEDVFVDMGLERV